MRTGYRVSLSLLLAGGLSLAAACGSDGGGGESATAPAQGAGAKVTITVGCQPPKTNAIERREWDEDVAAFQKLHPNIVVEGKDAFPCINPDTFQAKLAGGTMEDVFYVYFTDVAKIIAAGQAADITPYVKDVKGYSDLRQDVMSVFSSNGKVYGLPRNNYSMGLVYNRKLFTQAGLDPDKPPATWAEVREAAKKIAALGPGYVGFGEYSAGNTGGWHFTASLYARGGEMVTPDGKQAAFNSPQGKAVLQNLHDMRWVDNSMGSKQLLQWEDLMRMMGGGKLGMMLGAPDVVQAVNNDFKGNFEDYGVAPVPESTVSLSGGDGYMFNPKASPEKIKAGLAWLEFKFLTPGKGQFDYARAKQIGRPVGLPYPDLYGDTAPGKEILKLREESATVPTQNYAAYVAKAGTITGKLEPPKAQELYAILDTPMSAVLTRKDANIDQLLADAEAKANKVLAKQG
ncbi:multiple sugar transport system substrate-binding protein [Thermocatellispora tengchongensis]|uniref:Multiple sugar transport system substrate-binding protein n=1 Tax=Thermocatellispora tengchongensis TaxID=1073253 RepID=A0A840PRC9_9ACTN|nr:extracellular solute-binding protein [Thermocatellispora tengchongensis]MBB5140350.1 multiple sugar transport system substrate-binding protein [Thermocatellispora tengchongensis]